MKAFIISSVVDYATYTKDNFRIELHCIMDDHITVPRQFYNDPSIMLVLNSNTLDLQYNEYLEEISFYATFGGKGFLVSIPLNNIAAIKANEMLLQFEYTPRKGSKNPPANLEVLANGNPKLTDKRANLKLVKINSCNL